MVRTAVLLTTFLIVLIAPAQTADKPKEAPVALERKLHGGWKGGACLGDWTFAADGTFELRHYTPAGITLSGTWRVRWDALPPTMVLTCTASDDADRVGKAFEVKLVQLDDETFVYQSPDGQPLRCTRVPGVLTREKELDGELAALQGTWVPLHYEEGGKTAPGEITTRHVVKGDRLTVQVNGATHAEGKVVLDATKSPKRLEFQLTSGQTHAIAYVRAGNYVIYCGNRDGKTWPSEFASGTAKGGEYLIAWKIEK